MDLTNKKIIITGANGGLGRVVAQRVLDLGADAILLDLAFNDHSYDLQGRNIQKIEVNLLDSQSLIVCFEKIGDFDAVCNLAGGFSMGPAVYETSQKDWDHIFDLNVNTLRNVLHYATPTLLGKGSGSIINVGALSGHKGQAQLGAYIASKSTVMRITESLSEEVKSQGINVNAVLPSIIDTPKNREDMPDADFGAWVSPTDLANVICFLASDASSAIHGALIPVTGLV